jgi:hypothetical protein
LTIPNVQAKKSFSDAGYFPSMKSARLTFIFVLW